MLKQLQYFQSVVRLNNFSAAAEENFISQSAISQQVQALVRGKEPILRNYCAFWKKDNSGYYVEEFAKMLKAQFEDEHNPEKSGNGKHDR